MVNNSTNIKKTNNRLSSYLFEHKKDRHNDFGNPGSGLECVQNVQNLFTLFRQCSDTSDNVQNFQSMFRIFSQCSECSESVQNFQSMFRMFRICSEFSVQVQNVQNLFRLFQNFQHNNWSIQNYLTVQCSVYLNLCLSVMLNSLSCPFTFISFLTN